MLLLVMAEAIEQFDERTPSLISQHDARPHAGFIDHKSSAPGHYRFEERAMTSADVLAAFGQLKTGSRDGQRLPHKPLLVLLALGRWAQGDHGAIPFADVEKKLESLIRTYGPKGAGHPQEPFWRLRRDGLWDLGGTDGLVSPEATTPPGLRELRAGVTGRFCADIRDAFEADPALVDRVAHAILSEHFPPSLHQDIADVVGLDLSGPGEDDSSPSKKRSRDPTFRDRVLTAYGNRCALCGLKLHLGLTPFAVGVEAAHVRWFAYDGPDSITNGVAFCAFHHKAFDLGAFAIEDDLTVLVSEEVNGDGHDVLLKREPLRIMPTACGEDRPLPDHLAWHRDQVFRGRART
jgi:putative restriction endonuclease